jgi:Tfp pilus assembly protein PilN
MVNKFKDHISNFNKREALAIDIGADALRAVIVKKDGKNISVAAAAESADDQQTMSNGLLTGQKFNGPRLKGLLEKLGSYPKQAVLVSPEARFLTAELPISSSAKLSSDKLREAARWEAQAYLDFPAQDGLFGYQTQQMDGQYLKEEFLKSADTSGKVTPVLITAMSKKIYGRLAQICRGQRIRLKGVYTQEGVFDFPADRISKEGEVIDDRYKPAIDAALQQLKVVGSGRLGISDRVSLLKLMKVKVHVLPLIMVGIFTLGFLTHYAIVKISYLRYSGRLEKLKLEKTRLSSSLTTLKDLKTQTRNTYAKKHYIDGLPEKNRLLLGLFDGVTEALPYDVVLDSITQNRTNSSVFTITGSGLSADSITKFMLQLENLKVAREARLQSINQKKAASEKRELFLYSFVIKVVLRKNG